MYVINSKNKQNNLGKVYSKYLVQRSVLLQ